MIVFDLDDTLLDTSGGITPFKLKEALSFLFEDVGEELYQELLVLNRTASSSKEALAALAKRRGARQENILRAFAALTSPLPPQFFIPTTPGALQVLRTLHSLCPLVLVTGGKPSFQLEKMEKAGIDRSLFSKIVVSEKGSKGEAYADLPGEFSLRPEQIWVCGDRVEMDLRPARELGFHTVQMQWGRGGRESADWVEHRISLLNELYRRIVQ
ncbi:MAG: HAD family hydrolase [Verrucomicrobiota bacterium]|nr:HAD family hydrolase [Verrucomicrobiota bacterium]